MIRASSISLAESIAVAINTDTPLGAKPLVAGLVEESFGIDAYSDQFRNEIQHVTKDITDHTTILDMTSGRLAEIIRGALDTINVYGVPYARALANEVSVHYTPARLQEVGLSELNYRFINVDDPFFDSSLYPEVVKNTAFEFNNISLRALERLEFNYPTSEEVRAFVNSTHPDIVAILDDGNYELSSVISYLTNHHELGELFFCKELVFDFTKVRDMEISRLLKMYVVLTAMYASEEPAPWLAKGSLGDYREFISLLWNGLTRYLIALKELALLYRSRVVVLGELSPVSLVLSKNESHSGARFLSGNIRVYYTNRAMDALEKAGIGFGDWLVAVLWSRYNNAPLDPLVALGDADGVKAMAANYYNEVNMKMMANARAAFIKAASDASLRFVMSHELIAERLREIVGNTDLPGPWFVAQMQSEFEPAFHMVSKALSGHDGQAAIDAGDTSSPFLGALLASNLVPAMLRAIKCDTAAAIIEETYVSGTEADTVQKQRERLHIALIKLAVNSSIIGR